MPIRANPWSKKARRASETRLPLPTYPVPVYFSHTLATVIALAASFSANAKTLPAPPRLIPCPAEMTMLLDTFTLTPDTTLGAQSPEETAAAHFLAASLRPATGFPLPIRTAAAVPGGMIFIHVTAFLPLRLSQAARR